MAKDKNPLFLRPKIATTLPGIWSVRISSNSFTRPRFKDKMQQSIRFSAYWSCKNLKGMIASIEGYQHLGCVYVFQILSDLLQTPTYLLTSAGLPFALKCSAISCRYYGSKHFGAFAFWLPNEGAGPKMKQDKFCPLFPICGSVVNRMGPTRLAIYVHVESQMTVVGVHLHRSTYHTDRSCHNNGPCPNDVPHFVKAGWCFDVTQVWFILRTRSLKTGKAMHWHLLERATTSNALQERLIYVISC